jgi:anaphase-promoting complex subunit 8
VLRFKTKLFRAAELLTALDLPDQDAGSDTEPDSPMDGAEPIQPPCPTVVTTNLESAEAKLEARELHKFLLAKSYFDCREYDRCAAVFLPSRLPRSTASTASPLKAKQPTPSLRKGKSKASTNPSIPPRNQFPQLSQKALFLALYAKYMSGEKRKDEDSEMVLGPQDGGATVNKELVGLGRGLEGWFAERKEGQEERYGQGWLEYLYGIVLAKGKNEEEAKSWLIRSVHLYPYNWGAWLELSELLGNVEEVCQG